MVFHMTKLPAGTLSKVPEVTLGFWVIKVLATTLGETGGDAVTMSMNLGYAIGSFIFIGIFAAAVVAQIFAKAFHPFLYWVTIVRRQPWVQRWRTSPIVRSASVISADRRFCSRG